MTITRSRPAANPAPAANPDAYTTTGAGAALSVPAPGVLANDVGSGPLTAQLVGQPIQGTLDFHPDGSFTYTPDERLQGPIHSPIRQATGPRPRTLPTVTITINPLGYR